MRKAVLSFIIQKLWPRLKVCRETDGQIGQNMVHGTGHDVKSMVLNERYFGKECEHEIRKSYQLQETRVHKTRLYQ